MPLSYSLALCLDRLEAITRRFLVKYFFIIFILAIQPLFQHAPQTVLYVRACDSLTLQIFYANAPITIPMSMVFHSKEVGNIFARTYDDKMNVYLNIVEYTEQ